MFNPGFFLIVYNLLKRKICNSFFVLLNLIFIFQVEKSILRDDYITINVNSIVIQINVSRASLTFIFQTKMLSDMIMQPRVIVIILLFHETFFNDDCENISDNTNWDKNVSVQKYLCKHRVDLNQIIISIPNHVTMH